MCRAPVEGGCGRKAGFSGYCPAHYWRLRHGKDMTTPITGWANKSGCGTCISCGKKMARLAAKGLCEACYQRARRLKMREISGGKLISVKEMKAKGIDGEFRNAVGKVLEKNGMKVPAVYQGTRFSPSISRNSRSLSSASSEAAPKERTKKFPPAHEGCFRKKKVRIIDADLFL